MRKDEEAIATKKEALQVINQGGMKIRRVFPTPLFSPIDPFLFLDHFSIQKPSGFPTHPHGGFEIITYMLEGALAHKDSTGQDGIVETGGLQRITAGKGVEHSEFPAREGVNQGLQLWINLPRQYKNIDPGYQDVSPEEVPVEETEGIRVKTLVGENSPVRLHQPIQYFDVSVSAGKTYSYTIPDGYQGLLYVLEGEGRFNESFEVAPYEAIPFEPGNSQITLATSKGIRFVLLAGKPIGEKPKFRGGFVD